MSKLREKLKILLKHWIITIEGHAQKFREWAEEARGVGEIKVCGEISKTAQEMDKANKPLQALRKLEEN
jgi:hypothetical protein